MPPKKNTKKKQAGEGVFIRPTQMGSGLLKQVRFMQLESANASPEMYDLKKKMSSFIL